MRLCLLRDSVTYRLIYKEVEFVKDVYGKTIRVEKPNGLRKKTIGDSNPDQSEQLRLVCYYNEPISCFNEPLLLIPENPKENGVLVKNENGEFINHPAPEDILNERRASYASISDCEEDRMIAVREPDMCDSGVEDMSRRGSLCNSTNTTTCSSPVTTVDEERIEMLRRASSSTPSNGGDPIAMLLAAASLEEKAKAELEKNEDQGAVSRCTSMSQKQHAHNMQHQPHVQQQNHNPNVQRNSSSQFQPYSPSLLMTPPATPTTASPRAPRASVSSGYGGSNSSYSKNGFNGKANNSNSGSFSSSSSMNFSSSSSSSLGSSSSNGGIETRDFHHPVTHSFSSSTASSESVGTQSTSNIGGYLPGGRKMCYTWKNTGIGHFEMVKDSQKELQQLSHKENGTPTFNRQSATRRMSCSDVGRNRRTSTGEVEYFGRRKNSLCRASSNYLGHDGNGNGNFANNFSVNVIRTKPMKGVNGRSNSDPNTFNPSVENFSSVAMNS
eukprot:Nk52_evm57s158 gene=Nk52_evmTU57s158